MTPNEVKGIVYEVLKEVLGNYEVTDDAIIIRKPIRTFATKDGAYGVVATRASSISAPTAPGGVYNQTVAQTADDAINSIRTALTNFGITN